MKSFQEVREAVGDVAIAHQTPYGTVTATKRNTKGMRGKQDGYTLTLKTKSGKTVDLGSHPKPTKANVLSIAKNVMQKESVELDEATKTFKSLEDWVMSVVNAGGSVAKRANNLVGTGLRRTQSATFELKKGRGSMVESVELDEKIGNMGPYSMAEVKAALKAAGVKGAQAINVTGALRKK